MTTSMDRDDIQQVAIEEEMRRSYLDYAMSVIVSRALPDVRDGLKPVHRRILYGMKEANNDSNRPYRKSARTVGEVMGKYHPHGESAIYDSMVRMAQNFSLRVPLVDGQGNFGSMDGDKAAAMRYTEARLSKPAHDILADFEKGTVDFMPNYDESTKEPVVLPARFPNLLVNGGNGIAVGMATNIPPHNLGEVIDAACAMLDDPDITIENLMQIVPGPDFPTGAHILGRAGIYQAYNTGRGSIMMRAKTSIEEVRKDREAIIVHEIPFQVNKAKMIERMAELVKDKTIEGISDLRDESDRRGVRVVIEIKRDAVADVVLNQLYRYTPLQTSFGINMLALNHGRPEQMGLKAILEAFLEFREEVILRRTRFELAKAREKAHTYIGLAVAVANLDPIIKLIKEAPNPATAKEQLMEQSWPAATVAPLIELVEPETKLMDSAYKMTEAQAKAILDLKLHRLTGLERDKIADDLQVIVDEIQELLHILGSRERLIEVLRGEMLEVKESYSTPRRTEILEGGADVDMEDLIQREDMVVTVSHSGYIKRVPLSTYRAQRRGGKGRSGMTTKEEDIVSEVFVANTHSPVLFFSSKGKAYQLKAYRLPMGSPTSKGRPMLNILPLDKDEVISTVMVLPEDQESWDDMFVMFATSSGSARRNRLSDFLNIKANGKIAMKLDEGEELIAVKVCRNDQDVLLSADSGKCIRFNVTDIRVFAGRNSTGVRGIKLSEGDRIISMSILDHLQVSTEERDNYLKQSSKLRQIAGELATDEETQGLADEVPSMLPERFQAMAEAEQFILTLTENGFGKRSSAYEYRTTGRGGVGIDSIITNERNGGVVASFPVADDDEIMLVTDSGQLIRCPVTDIRIAGRRTQGVIVFRVADGTKVVSVSRIPGGGDDEFNDDNDSDYDESSSHGTANPVMEATEDSSESTEN